MSTDHKLWRERRAEADSNRGPSVYQPNALPLGQTDSQYGVRSQQLYRAVWGKKAWCASRFQAGMAAPPRTRRDVRTVSPEMPSESLERAAFSGDDHQQVCHNPGDHTRPVPPSTWPVSAVAVREGIQGAEGTCQPPERRLLPPCRWCSQPRHGGLNPTLVRHWCSVRLSVRQEHVI